MSDISDQEPENSEFDDNSQSHSIGGEELEPEVSGITSSDVDSKERQSVTSESDSEEEQQIVRSGAPLSQSRGKKVNKDERITPPFLTKYERARVIGTRALQISKNSPIYVDPKETTDPILVAQQELNENKIPFIIRRYWPNGNFEDWELQELERLD
ncbi:unnamed protein product (macronuclear) [Paramecium tetraurelia]|uniref:Uncharacterized protein n=1 Tax=Paramecium tetraurelia TaxID=5888 RepID=A0CFC7_PARTE|nr:uncharacterized protein GSPATT00037933001 [Paramecium tetraurelia]CAK69494.1 unnamed protein product [Paramecium tetraurelia]|eukprot:XP_001436891.1 hypothetical protein (macronuclear) [Paramecium tetraurelia strain d4-2]